MDGVDPRSASKIRRVGGDSQKRKTTSLRPAALSLRPRASSLIAQAFHQRAKHLPHLDCLGYERRKLALADDVGIAREHQVRFELRTRTGRDAQESGELLLALLPATLGDVGRNR